MRLLQLELAPRAQRPWLLGLSLAAAAFVAVDTLWQAQRLRDDLAAAQAAQAERRLNVGAAAPSPALALSNPELARGIREAEQVVQRLAQPWDTLFQAIEAATTPRVALLAVEPDTASTTVAISGEAADHKAVIEYLHRLGAEGRFHGVHLLRHELRSDDPQRPIAFTLQAQWRGAKP